MFDPQATKVIERESPAAGECEDCGEATEDGVMLTLETGEELLVCGECSGMYRDAEEDEGEEG
jgi:hypothetical protein